MDDMNFGGNQMPDIEPTTDFPDGIGDSVIPDPVASPDSYDSDFGIPDPVASPDSYSSDFGIPDPVASPDSYDSSFGSSDPAASPDSYGDFSIPTPEPVTETITAESIVSPMMEKPEPKAEPAPANTIPAQNQPHSTDYSGHFSWNGSQYVEQNANPVPPQNGYERSGYTSAQSGTNSVPNYGQPVYTQNAFGQGQANLDPEVEKRANTVKTLGIFSLVSFFVCCSCLSPILAIIGIVKANGLNTVTHMMSEESQKSVKLGKTLCIVSLILGILGTLGGFVTTFLPALIGYMEAASGYGCFMM